MLRTRIIPSLLVKNSGLVKTVKFDRSKYVGDPINAIKIFNDKEVDELVVLDIEASRRGNIDFPLLSRINKEAFMPLGYGGGIKSIDDVKRILQLGYEKIIINSALFSDPNLITQCARACGSQSVVVCIDVKRGLLNSLMVYSHIKRKTTNINAVNWAVRSQELGAGEILLYSVDRDGTYRGYDIPLVQAITSAVTVPVVALGGASNLTDLKEVIKEGHASAAAAGSMFVFHGPHKAVLISYPKKSDLNKIFN